MENNTVRFSLYLPLEVYDGLKEISEKNLRSMNGQAVYLLAKGIERENAKDINE